MKTAHSETPLHIFNTLIAFNNDRISGYETALRETKETDLEALFSEFIQTSITCREELITEVRRLGGIPEEKTIP